MTTDIVLESVTDPEHMNEQNDKICTWHNRESGQLKVCMQEISRVLTCGLLPLSSQLESILYWFHSLNVVIKKLRIIHT